VGGAYRPLRVPKYNLLASRLSTYFDVTTLENCTKIGTHSPTGVQTRRKLPDDASDKAHWASG